MMILFLSVGTLSLCKKRITSAGKVYLHEHTSPVVKSVITTSLWVL